MNHMDDRKQALLMNKENINNNNINQDLDIPQQDQSIDESQDNNIPNIELLQSDQSPVNNIENNDNEEVKQALLMNKENINNNNINQDLDIPQQDQFLVDS